MRYDPVDHTTTPDPRDCRAVVLLLWDYLDGTLSDRDVRAVDAHLADCELCPPHFAFERAFLRVVRAARAEPARSDALRARVVAALASEGFTSTERD